MPSTHRWLAAGLVLACLPLASCGSKSEFDSEAASDEGPAKVEPIKGTDVSEVTLTARAAKRLGIRTTAVRATRGGTIVPFGAVIYDENGHAFTFTSPRRNVFVRRPITVDHITGNRAVLDSGPRPGTVVVTVGSPELLGTEYGVEED